MSAGFDNIQLFHEPKDRLRMTRDDRSWPTVKPAWSAPLSRPKQFLVLLNGKGEEIVMIPNPADLPDASRSAVEIELGRRYLTSIISRVVKADSQFGATYWHVETERGTRDFVTQSLQENAQWLSPTHLLLIDVDGNRFELQNTEALDPVSRAFLKDVL
jgi:hypothetical protein